MHPMPSNATNARIGLSSCTAPAGRLVRAGRGRSEDVRRAGLQTPSPPGDFMALLLMASGCTSAKAETQGGDSGLAGRALFGDPGHVLQPPGGTAAGSVPSVVQRRGNSS
jgi:hypothetical protein